MRTLRIPFSWILLGVVATMVVIGPFVLPAFGLSLALFLAAQLIRMVAYGTAFAAWPLRRRFTSVRIYVLGLAVCASAGIAAAFESLQTLPPPTATVAAALSAVWAAGWAAMAYVVTRAHHHASGR